MYEEFYEIVEGYKPAAKKLFQSDAHVEEAIRGLALRLPNQCVSCCFSRAPKNIMEMAIARNRLCTDVRRCIFGHQYNGSRGCPTWEQLKVPEIEMCGLCNEAEAAPEDWVCPTCRNHLNGLSPKTKKANKPDGGTGHGHLRLRRASSGY
jgi:hypothetical protein